MDWTQASTTDLINAEYDWRLTADEKAAAKSEQNRRQQVAIERIRTAPKTSPAPTPKPRRTITLADGRVMDLAEYNRGIRVSRSIHHPTRSDIRAEARALGNPAPPRVDGHYDW